MSRARKFHTRTKGSVALMHCGLSPAGIAQRLEVTDTIVNCWLSGEKKPGPKNRKKCKAEFGIALSAWDTPFEAVAPTQPTDVLEKIRIKNLPEGTRVPLPPGTFEVLNTVPLPATTTREVRDTAGMFIEQAEVLMRQVTTDKILSMPEKSRILKECVTSIERAGRLTGASSEISVAKILKSPAWAKLGKVIADTILAYEDQKVAATILRSVGEALKGAE